MITELNIFNFRGFKKFTVTNLGRINLLVGLNNSGKSSILEAISIASSAGDPYCIWKAAYHRGEQISDGIDTRFPSRLLADITHLFHGHEIEIGSEFSISTFNSTQGLKQFIARIKKNREVNENELFFEDRETAVNDPGNEPRRSNMSIYLEWLHSEMKINLPISIDGGISMNDLRSSVPGKIKAQNKISEITTSGLSAREIITMFEEIVLTEEEDSVIEALKTIEPAIERIATITNDMSTRDYRLLRDQRGGIVIKCSNSKARTPIGSMGDGLWRMLGLALAMANAKDGILLVDEIDTGLHYTTLETMWKLIDVASKRLNIQVFATTQSRDAYESLACISNMRSSVNEITIQRIDKNNSESVFFTEAEIIQAANRGTEVR